MSSFCDLFKVYSGIIGFLADRQYNPASKNPQVFNYVAEEVKNKYNDRTVGFF